MIKLIEIIDHLYEIIYINPDHIISIKTVKETYDDSIDSYSKVLLQTDKTIYSVSTVNDIINKLNAS